MVQALLWFNLLGRDLAGWDEHNRGNWVLKKLAGLLLAPATSSAGPLTFWVCFPTFPLGWGEAELYSWLCPHLLSMSYTCQVLCGVYLSVVYGKLNYFPLRSSISDSEYTIWVGHVLNPRRITSVSSQSCGASQVLVGGPLCSSTLSAALMGGHRWGRGASGLAHLPAHQLPPRPRKLCCGLCPLVLPAVLREVPAWATPCLLEPWLKWYLFIKASETTKNCICHLPMSSIFSLIY